MRILYFLIFVLIITPVKADMMILLSDQDIQKLQELQKEKKFVEESYYFPPDEQTRLRIEASLNNLIGRLIAEQSPQSSKAGVLAEFKTTLSLFDTEESDDQDRMLHYLETIMDIYGIESSDGLLNTWRYGFDPTG